MDVDRKKGEFNMICSRCGRELDKMYIKITTSFEVVSITEEGCSVPYENVAEPTSEFLCLDCFNEYCDLIENLNKSNDGKLIADMVQVVDEVQYGSGVPRVQSTPSENFSCDISSLDSLENLEEERNTFSKNSGENQCEEGCVSKENNIPLSLAEMIKYLDE